MSESLLTILSENLLTTLILINVLLGYFTIIYGLRKFGIFEKYNVSLVLGFIIMWRTKRGRKLIDRLSQRRTFWRLYGNLAIIICLFAMVIMFFLLFVGAIAIISIRPDPVPFHHMLVLPGLNPMIPLWYGIIALSVAIILHEFTHGILARRVKIKLKSLGVLLCIIPIGAFVEPDEKQMEKINKKDRSRIFASGLGTNIIFGLIFAGIFSWGFMAALEPVEPGVIVLNVTEDFPADVSGIKPGMVLTSIEYIDENGTMIEKVEIETYEDFSGFMDKRKYNETINITAYYSRKFIHFNNITLADQYNNTKREEDRGAGFLGVGVSGADDFVDSLAYPVRSAGSNVSQRRLNLIKYSVIYPMSSFDPTGKSATILPFKSPLTDAYEVTGPMSVLPESVFWGLANTFYYLFWINILLGIFNAIPAVPLDGGYVFRDGMAGFLSRLKPSWDKKTQEKYINTFSLSLAFLILILILIMMFGSYLFAFFK